MNGKSFNLLCLCVMGSLALFLVPRTILAESKVVISTFNYSPYMDDSLPHKGMFPELTSKAYEAVGYDVSFEFYPLKRSILYVKTGRFVADLGSARHYNPGDIDPVPVFYCKVVGFYLKDKVETIRFKTLKDLHGYRIGVISGGSDYNFLMNDKELKVEDVNTMKQLFFKLFYGNRQDIVFALDLSGLSFVSKYFPDDTERWAMTEDVLMGIVAHISFSKAYPDYETYRDKFKEGIEVIRKNGELHRIYETYYGVGKVPPDINQINNGDYVLPNE